MAVRTMRGNLLMTAIALAVAGCGLAACGTSDEDEARAVAGEFRRAIDTDDGERACRLLTARARSRLANCEQAVGGAEPAGDDAPVTIDGDRATVGARDSAGRLTLLKVDGNWRIDALLTPADATQADTPADAAFYERCWREAGAQIATTPTQLAFAAADRPVVALRADRVSAKGGDWRIFYTLPPGGRDPGLAQIIRDPGAAAVVAYIENAGEHAGVVERTRACEAPS